MRTERAGAMVRWGGALVAALVAVAAAAPWLAPHDPGEQLDPAASRHRPPASVLEVVRLEDGRVLAADRVERRGERLELSRRGEIVSVPLTEVANLDPDGGVAERRRYLLGSDRFGRDVLSRILLGARVSLGIGIAAITLALVIGVAIGGCAGLAGGLVDASLMRLVDAALAFPRLFLVVAAAALFHSGPVVVVAVIGATSWMGLARVVRGEIRSVNQRDFVLAARAVGAGPARIFVRHLLPNALTPILVHAALRVGDFILLEAALSFLGLGIQPPTASWGNMIADGRDVLTSAWWVSAFPGLAIALTVIAFNLLSDGLRDWLDPRA